MSEQTSPNKPHAIKIHVAGKEYQIACPDGQEGKLRACANYVNQQIRLARSHGLTPLNAEQAAVMTALNLCSEMIQTQQNLPGSPATKKEETKPMVAEAS